MRFIHSADWQIGKVFKQFGPKEESLRQARLAAIERLGELAIAHDTNHVLVAGDVYDNEAPSPITLRTPIERMKSFPAVHWHLLPGNHDPHRPEGVWDRLAHMGLPDHIHLHLTPSPFELDAGAVLLPAPLARKTEFDDITSWMNDAATPPGIIRIGLAHGSVTKFGREREATNPIDPGRPKSAGLAYLALGDWHRTMQVGPAVWYAGTPEPDRADSQESGTALLVEIAGHAAPAAVTPLGTGTYRWVSVTARLDDDVTILDLEQRLRSEPDLSRLIVRLQLEGHLSIAAHAKIHDRIVDLKAALFHLDLDQSGLFVRPSASDLEAIDFDGVLRRCADRLKSLVDDKSQTAEARHRAEEALVELYLKAAMPGNREAA
jgi:DNA repair exonuclease SbcCD nuclease subunit